MKRIFILAGSVALSLAPVSPAAEPKPEPLITEQNKGCVDCHRKLSPALVMEWERSKHAVIGTGCVDCHKAKEGDLGAWKHEGAVITPVGGAGADCGGSGAAVERGGGVVRAGRKQFATSNPVTAGNPATGV